jgi:hypothetical protein
LLRLNVEARTDDILAARTAEVLAMIDGSDGDAGGAMSGDSMTGTDGKDGPP